MNARAETRGLKRAIEILFGSVINYCVKNIVESNNGRIKPLSISFKT